MGNFTKVGVQDLNGIFLKNMAQNSQLYLGLFTNDISALAPADVVLSDLVEPVASTYVRQILTPSNWIVVSQVATYPDIDFEVLLESYGTIYGCFIATSLDNSGLLVALDIFSAPVDLINYGDRVGITPRITIT